MAGTSRTAESARVARLVAPGWPPLRHVERGWRHLRPSARTCVERRLEAAVGGARLDGRRDALGRLFAFLAQVETIAIEVPLRALPSADARQRRLLERQLADEVFHSLLFTRLAHELADGKATPPVASARRLLERIRSEPDTAVAALMLNLVAEGWIETIFEHAATWGAADEVFLEVLADEARHVEEAHAYMAGLDPSAAADAVAALEEGLMEVGAEPGVALALLDVAGAEGYRRLVQDLHARHEARLAGVGLAPSPAWRQMRQDAEGLLARAAADEAVPRPVPDTAWRRAARDVWATPRDPTMAGGLDVPVGHIPKRLLTPVLVAAVGAAWAERPELNRVLARGRVWQLPHVNVGVRVLLEDGGLATVVVPEADRRSVRDIQRMVADGVRQLEDAGRRTRRDGPTVPPPALDPAVAALVPPDSTWFAVALSNPGRFGVEQGSGALSGAISPSTDISVGLRRRRPLWRVAMYVPAWHVHLGAVQDHRVLDGREAGLGMAALRRALSRRGVRRILKRQDTLPPEPPDGDAAAWLAGMVPAPLRLVPQVGFTKYLPVALGGLGLGAALGVGGWLLYHNLAGAGAGAGGAGAEATGATAAAGGGDAGAGAHPVDAADAADAADGADGADGADAATSPKNTGFDALLSDGRARCQSMTKKGAQCRLPARETGGACARHGGG